MSKGSGPEDKMNIYNIIRMINGQIKNDNGSFELNNVVRNFYHSSLHFAQKDKVKNRYR